VGMTRFSVLSAIVLGSVALGGCGSSSDPRTDILTLTEGTTVYTATKWAAASDGFGGGSLKSTPSAGTMALTIQFVDPSPQSGCVYGSGKTFLLSDYTCVQINGTATQASDSVSNSTGGAGTVTITSWSLNHSGTIELSFSGDAAIQGGSGLATTVTLSGAAGGQVQ
jgi:hypothetical protein